MQRDYTYERYVRSIAKYKRITPEREVELSRIINKGRKKKAIEAAVTEMVEANLRLVLHCLKDFRGYLGMPDVALTRMDLIAEGNIALMNAARKFNAEYESNSKRSKSSSVRFSTYACKSIKCAMRRAVRLSRFIHIPENHFNYWSKIDAIKKDRGAVTNEMILHELDITPSKLEKLEASSESGTSRLEDMGPKDESYNWADVIPDTTKDDPERKAEKKDLKKHLLREMQSLPARTRKIIYAMFLSNNLSTLSELSKRFGVSKERCRQIGARGLQILRQRMENRWSRTGDLQAFGLFPSHAATATLVSMQGADSWREEEYETAYVA